MISVPATSREHAIFSTIGRSGLRFELALERGDIDKRRQARLIAEALNLVGGGRPREAEMMLPSLRRTGEVGVDVRAVKDVAGSTGIEDSIRRYGKRGKDPDGATVVVPDQAALSQRHSANPAAPALEIVEHRRWLMSQLLAQALGHDRDVDEAEQLAGIRPKSATVERGENPSFAAQPGVVDRGLRLVAVQVQRAAAREAQDRKG
jgi:hypothetical protein